MNTLRKLQLGSAIVIANGLSILLSSVSPVVLADSCASHNNDVPCICAINPPAVCAQVSGCTLTETCAPIGGPECGGVNLTTLCRYN